MKNFFNNNYLSKNKIISILSIILLSSCSCPRDLEIDTFSKNDKSLNCNEILMEINEAEFYRRNAINRKKNLSKYTYNLFCYPTAKLNIEDIVEASDNRMVYLKHIYDILGCGQKLQTTPYINNR